MYYLLSNFRVKPIFHQHHHRPNFPFSKEFELGIVSWFPQAGHVPGFRDFSNIKMDGFSLEREKKCKKKKKSFPSFNLLWSTLLEFVCILPAYRLNFGVSFTICCVRKRQFREKIFQRLPDWEWCFEFLLPGSRERAIKVV